MNTISVNNCEGCPFSFQSLCVEGGFVKARQRLIQGIPERCPLRGKIHIIQVALTSRHATSVTVIDRFIEESHEKEVSWMKRITRTITSGKRKNYLSKEHINKPRTRPVLVSTRTPKKASK